MTFFYFLLCSGKWSEAPYTVYNVAYNQKYRFRVIGAGLNAAFRISVDEHMLELVATDGYDITPIPVESFIIYPGERYDFIVQMNQTAKTNYWIRATAFDVIIFTHVTLEKRA